MGWKIAIVAALLLLGAATAIVLPRVPGYWLAPNDEVKRAVRAIHTQTAGLRQVIGGELLYAKQIEPDFSVRSDPDYGTYLVRVNESGTIVARSCSSGGEARFQSLIGKLTTSLMGLGKNGAASAATASV